MKTSEALLAVGATVYILVTVGLSIAFLVNLANLILYVGG